MIPPDYDDDTPFDYHPDPKSWLIPETGTGQGNSLAVEDLWAEAAASAQGIAVYHRFQVLLSVMGNGTRFLIRVCKHPVVVGTASATVAGAICGTAGVIVTGDVVNSAVSNGVSSGVGALIMFLLSRREAVIHTTLGK